MNEKMDGPTYKLICLQAWKVFLFVAAVSRKFYRQLFFFFISERRRKKILDVEKEKERDSLKPSHILRL